MPPPERVTGIGGIFFKARDKDRSSTTRTTSDRVRSRS